MKEINQIKDIVEKAIAKTTFENRNKQVSIVLNEENKVNFRVRIDEKDNEFTSEIYVSETSIERFKLTLEYKVKLHHTK